jgi:Nuclease-related domain
MARPRLRNPRSLLRFGHHRSGTTPDETPAHEAARDSAADNGAARDDIAPKDGGAGSGAEVSGGGAGAGGTAEANGAATAVHGAAANGGATAGRGAGADGGAAGRGAGANGGAAGRGAEANGGAAGRGAEANGGEAAGDAPSEVQGAWPNANGAATQSPTAAPEAAEDSADVPIWGWASPEESAEPDESGNGLPRDVPSGEGGSGEAGAGAGPAGSRHSPEPVVTSVTAAGEEPRRDGIGQHLGNLAHLSADPRKRAWQRRAIIAIVVGVVFSIVVSWRLGLTLAVLAAVVDTIYRSRTTFTGQGQAQLNAAQRRTRRQLGKLARTGYRAIDNVQIPGSEDRIDHLVIGRAGVFSIDSEAWDRRLPLRPRLGRELWHGPHNMSDELEHARWESEQAGELLSRAVGSKVTVRPAMAVYGPKMPWHVVTIRDIDVFRGTELRKYLRGRARRNRGNLLKATDIERIEKAAHQAFPQTPLADPPSR